MRLAAIALLLALGPGPVLAAEALPVIHSGGTEYVALEEGAIHLGLRLERSVPLTSVMLKDGSQPVAKLADRSRDADIRGLRVFLGDPVVERGGKFYVSRTDFEDRLAPRLRPELCGDPPRPPRVIAIDPGHGGADHGTENHALGSMEKTYALDVSARLKRLLEGQGYKVAMTRDSDVDVPKQIRSEIANQAGADLMISIHFNSLYPNTKTTGVEVLSFPPRGQRSTNSWSPGQANDSEQSAAPVNRFDPWNTFLAGFMHRRLLDSLRSGDRGEKFEHLGVLRGLKCPGVLLESAFLSSDAEAERLARPEYREKIAEAVVAGVADYAEALRRLQPASVAAPGQAPAGAPPPAPAPARLPPTRPSQAR